MKVTRVYSVMDTKITLEVEDGTHRLSLMRGGQLYPITEMGLWPEFKTFAEANKVAKEVFEEELQFWLMAIKDSIANG